MSLVVFVLVVAAAMAVWCLLCVVVPRLALVTDAIALTYVTVYALFDVGFGRTMLGFLTFCFGAFAAVGGLIARRQRMPEPVAFAARLLRKLKRAARSASS